MKALSITRPWAELILRGKDVENRTWNTRHRGPILLHAAQSWSKDATIYAQWIELRHDGYDFSNLSWRPADHSTGIVGVAEVAGVCSVMAESDPLLPCPCGPWAMRGQHHWRLTNVRRLAVPVPCRGTLSLWTPSPGVMASVNAQLAEAVAR